MAVNISGNGAIEGITSFNGGGLTFRNILYNGWVNTSSEINQRGKTIAQVSNGNYFADRWERVSSTTMTQKVEEKNYIPNRTYTLSGTNVTTVQVTSPASGTWDWGTVPSDASLVQLELGDTASSFEYRPYGLELSLCQRYYQFAYANIRSSAGYIFENAVTWNTQMRISPSIFTGGTPVNCIIRYLDIAPYGCRMEAVSQQPDGTDSYALEQILELNAEL